MSTENPIIGGCFYELATGRIIDVMKATETDIDAAFAADCDPLVHGYMLQSADPSRCYVDTSVTPHRLRERVAPQAVCNKVYIAADGVEAATISDLPDPCTLLVNGVSTPVTGGNYAFTTSVADGHLIIFNEPPYARQVWQIAAQPTV